MLGGGKTFYEPAVSRIVVDSECLGNGRESEGRQCATLSLGIAFRHRGVTVNAWNRRFTVDLSGACPRRWKSEVLSIDQRLCEIWGQIA